MAITQQNTLSNISFDLDETIHAEYAVAFLGDQGQQIGQGMGPTIVTYHPGDDVSAADAKVQALAAALWTQDVISAYKAANATVS